MKIIHSSEQKLNLLASRLVRGLMTLHPQPLAIRSRRHAAAGVAVHAAAARAAPPRPAAGEARREGHAGQEPPRGHH